MSGGQQVCRHWCIAARPRGAPRTEDFCLEQSELPEPGAGEVLLETLYLSVAPVMAMYMSGEAVADLPALDIGDVIHGRGVGRVLESRRDDVQPGELWHGQFGWRTHRVTAMTPAERFYRFTATDLPAHLALGALGMTGYSAYCGLVIAGRVKPGSSVLVSGAAGGVGHVVVQVARALGCSPVVGIAGGEEKCELLRKLGCDVAIDYRAGSLEQDIRMALPDGVDFYFDNVGGETLMAVLENLSHRATVLLCGSISEYTREQPFGLTNYTRLRRHDAVMRGFYVYNHTAEFASAQAQLANWIREDRLQPVQNVVDGFEQMPAALMGLYTGRNSGKQVVRVKAGET